MVSLVPPDVRGQLTREGARDHAREGPQAAGSLRALRRLPPDRSLLAALLAPRQPAPRFRLGPRPSRGRSVRDGGLGLPDDAAQGPRDRSEDVLGGRRRDARGPREAGPDPARPVGGLAALPGSETPGP